MHLQACRRRFREFGTIPNTYPNPPFSKPWAIAQAFWSKSADFGPFGIRPKSSPTLSKVVGNTFESIQEEIHGVWNESQHLPKSAIFKTMGYSPGFLVKIGRFRTLWNSPEIFTNIVESSWKSICKHVRGDLGSLERIPTLTQIRHFQNHGLQPRLFGQNRPISNPSEFTRNRHQDSRKQLQIHLQAYRKKFREFGTNRNTYPNPPFSKPWAIAQAFWSKSVDFEPFGIHPKSSPRFSKVVANTFASIQEEIQGVWNESQHLPKSAIFKTMGYSPGFLVKIGRFRTLWNSPIIVTNIVESTWKCICKHVGGDSGSLERIPTLTQIRHFQNHGLQPRLFGQNRPISDPSEFARNRHQHSRKQLEMHLQACRRGFREFGTNPNTYPNPPFSKPWAIAQAFWSKSADFGPFGFRQTSSPRFSKVVGNAFASMQEEIQGVWNESQHLPKSVVFKTMGYSPGFLVKIVRFRTLRNSPEIVTNILESSVKYICKHVGSNSGSLERIPTLTQIRHFQKHGLQPRLFGQNRPISDPSEFARNRHQHSRKQCEIHLQAYRKKFREFGTNPNTYPNPPFSKPWAIAQAFWSKSADFGPFGIRPKSSPRFSKVVGNTFASMQEEIQGVWNESQHLPKSAIFKIMGYSPGFLVKIDRFRTLWNSPIIFTNIVESSWKCICNHVGGDSGSLERIPTLTQIRRFQNHGLQPRLFGQNRPISDPSEFDRNRHQYSRKQCEIHLQAYRKKFREFGTNPNTYPNSPFSKPRLFGQNRPISDPSEFARNRHQHSRKQCEIHLQAYRKKFREFGTNPNTYPNPPFSNHGLQPRLFGQNRPISDPLEFT